MNISVVIPVYNSESSLSGLVQRLGQTLEASAENYELILVNDGNRDNSWGIIETLAKKYNWIRGIDLKQNCGQHNALLCGIRSAKFEIIITMDDDLQHPPEEIPKMLDKVAEGYDVVYGVPEKEKHTLWRRLASQLTKIALRNTMGIKMARNVSAFRAFRTNIRDSFSDYQSPFICIDVLLTWGTGKFTAVTVHHESRHVNVSNYTFRKLVVHAINMITSFSILPLRLSSILGFFFSVFGLLVLAYVVGRFLIQGTSVPGFPFLASIIAIFSGVQLFSLGIIGEYLARIHLRSIGKPPYVINTDTKKEPSTD